MRDARGADRGRMRDFSMLEPFLSFGTGSAVGMQFMARPLDQLSDEQLELAAYRFCSSEDGWKSWLEYRKDTAPVSDGPDF